MKNNGSNELLDKYVDEWSDMMVIIWQDKIRQMDIRDTGNLYNSIAAESVQDLNGTFVIPHKFVEYGIYVDAGVGKGFTPGNGGDLGFTPSREPRPWFNKKYYASFLTLRDAVQDIIGNEFMNRIVAAFS